MLRSLLSGAQTGWLVQATDYRKLNEPPRPRLQRNGTIYLDGAATPPLPRSIQSCPAGQRQNTQETAPSKTKDLSAQFLERGIRFKPSTAATIKCVYFPGLRDRRL